jgi:MoaA/NifB/PqqE/SkfB family radical SAM enzyme
MAPPQISTRKYELHITLPSFTPDEQPVCDQDPRDSLFIRHDGFVAPCINLARGGPTDFVGQQVTLPTVHYGRLPEHSLLDLWKTERCKFYRERFQLHNSHFGLIYSGKSQFLSIKRGAVHKELHPFTF